MICGNCGKGKDPYLQCNTAGFVVDDDGTKWISRMCGETNEEYVKRWVSYFKVAGETNEDEFWSRPDRLFKENGKRSDWITTAIWLAAISGFLALCFVKGW